MENTNRTGRTEDEQIEVRGIVQALTTYKKPEYAAQDLGMPIDALQSRMKYYGIPEDFDFEAATAAIRETIQSFDIITNFIKSAIPSTQKKKFQYAENYSKENDLVSAICKTKTDFGMSGFHVQSPDAKVQDFCDNINRVFDIDSIVQQLWEILPHQSNGIFYFKKEKCKELESVQIFEPKLMEILPLYTVKDGKPQKTSILHLPDDFKQLYRKQNRTEYKNLKSIKEALTKIPREYLAALNGHGVGAGKDGVELLENDGHYIELINYKGKKDRLLDPEMVAIFPDIRLRELIKDGDFSIFHHIKHMIHQIKVGSSQVPGQNVLLNALASQRLTEAQAVKIKGKYATIEKVLLEVTDDTVEHVFTAPDPKYLNVDKYLAVEQRILRYGGIALILISGESKASYAGGYIYMKSLVAEINKWRKIIERLLQNFYTTIAPGVGRNSLKSKMQNKDTMPRVKWNNQWNKEPAQLFNEIKFMITEGGLDWKTAHEQLGYSHSVILDRKKREWTEEDRKYMWPLWELHSGLLVPSSWNPLREEDDDGNGKPTKIEGEPGPPEKDGLQTNRDRRPRQPRPSEAQQLLNVVDSLVGIVDSLTAPYTTENFYHLDAKSKDWKSDDIVASKKLKNGIVLRLGRLKNGSTAVKIVLIPKSMFDSLEKAKKYVKDKDY